MGFQLLFHHRLYSKYLDRLIQSLIERPYDNLHILFFLYQASLANHQMEHVLIVSHHANIVTLLSQLNASAAQWANSFTCINAFLPNSALQAHMQIARLGYVKIARLDVPLAVLPLV